MKRIAEEMEGEANEQGADDYDYWGFCFDDDCNCRVDGTAHYGKGNEDDCW